VPAVWGLAHSSGANIELLAGRPIVAPSPTLAQTQTRVPRIHRADPLSFLLYITVQYIPLFLYLPHTSPKTFVCHLSNGYLSRLAVLTAHTVAISHTIDDALVQAAEPSE
jgi:hypothetical protein